MAICLHQFPVPNIAADKNYLVYYAVLNSCIPAAGTYTEEKVAKYRSVRNVS